MKKIIQITLFVLLLFTLFACNNTEGPEYVEQSLIDDIVEEFEREKELNEQRNNQLKEQINDLLEIIELLEESKKLISDEVEQLNSIIVQLNESLDEMEGTNESNNSQINILKNQIISLNSNVLELEVLNINHQEKINEMKKQYFDLITELELSEFEVVVESLEYDTLTKIIYFNDKYGFEISKVDYRIYHPLSKTLDNLSEDLYSGTIDNGADLHIEIQFPHHGYFEIEYEVSFKDHENKERIKTYKNKVFVSDTHYNLTWIHATQPVLLFASDLFYGTYDKGTTYVEIQRASTFNFDMLPSNALKYPQVISATKGNYNQAVVPNFFENVKSNSDNRMIKWMEELYYVNNDSTFTIVGVDNILDVVASSLISRVPIEKKSYKIYTDGTHSNTIIRDYYQTKGSTNYMKNLFLEKYNSYVDGTYDSPYLWEAYSIGASYLDNFEIILNNLDDLVASVEDLNYIRENYNIRILSTKEAFERLIPINKINNLEYLLKTRWGVNEDESMNSYFSGNPEKNLLILGTSLAGEANSLYAPFEKYLEYIIDNYSAEYKIYYKGHPKYPSSEERKTMFAANNILELPNSIPVETLMLLYPNVYVGGYSGTSFQSSLENQTIFFFGTKVQVSGNVVIKSMIEKGIFDNTVYLTVKDGEVYLNN